MPRCVTASQTYLFSVKDVVGLKSLGRVRDRTESVMK